jgi:purine-nucleoside phosphorylase
VTVAAKREAGARGSEERLVGRAGAALRRLAGGPLDAVVVLGSGVAGPTLEEGARTVPMEEVPGMVVPAVAGHPGELRIGRVRGARVAVFSGRCHLYEGYTPAQVVRPVRAAARAGARLLVATNASGGVAEWVRPGELMVLSDHLDLGLGDPAAGEADGAFGPRFQAMAGAYDEVLSAAAVEEARRERFPCGRGVYAFVRGPAFETAAEVRMLRALGADAVGMSTVPEVKAARRLGLRVVALSVIANRAGVPGDSHDTVVERVQARSAAVVRVLDAVLGALAGEAR